MAPTLITASYGFSKLEITNATFLIIFRLANIDCAILRDDNFGLMGFRSKLSFQLLRQVSGWLGEAVAMLVLARNAAKEMVFLFNGSPTSDQ
jgi:hypothetical protein